MECFFSVAYLFVRRLFAFLARFPVSLELPFSWLVAPLRTRPWGFLQLAGFHSGSGWRFGSRGPTTFGLPGTLQHPSSRLSLRRKRQARKRPTRKLARCVRRPVGRSVAAPSTVSSDHLEYAVQWSSTDAFLCFQWSRPAGCSQSSVL